MATSQPTFASLLSQITGMSPSSAIAPSGLGSSKSGLLPALPSLPDLAAPAPPVSIDSGTGGGSTSGGSTTVGTTTGGATDCCTPSVLNLWCLQYQLLRFALFILGMICIAGAIYLFKPGGNSIVSVPITLLKGGAKLAGKTVKAVGQAGEGAAEVA